MTLSLGEKDHLLGVAIPLGSGWALDVTHDLLGKKSDAIPCDRRKSNFNWAEPELTGDSGIAIQYHERARCSFSPSPSVCLFRGNLCASPRQFSTSQCWDQGKANKTSRVQDLKNLSPDLEDNYHIYSLISSF